MNSAKEIGPSAAIRRRSRSASPATLAILLDQSPSEVAQHPFAQLAQVGRQELELRLVGLVDPVQHPVHAAHELHDRLWEA